MEYRVIKLPDSTYALALVEINEAKEITMIKDILSHPQANSRRQLENDAYSIMASFQKPTIVNEEDGYGFIKEI